MLKANLHIHTRYSDGKLEPEIIAGIAKDKGICIISITDHDSIMGAVKALPFSGRYGVEIIPGIELSAGFNGREIHILGYFIDLSSKVLINHVDIIKKLRMKRIEKTIGKLKDMGLKLSADDLFERYVDSCSLGRPHIANEMLKNGFVGNLREAYDRYLGDNKPAFVRKENFDYSVIINLIKSSGGSAVLAHPGKAFRNKRLDEITKAGLDGIEILHPSHSESEVKYYGGFCSKHGLIPTGGSDFHGFLELDYENFGNYFVSEDVTIALKQQKTVI